MATATESKAALRVLGDDAVDTAEFVLNRTDGSFQSRRAQLLDTVPGVIAYYSEGSAALAADFYDESRTAVVPRRGFAAEIVLLDRTVRIRRGVAWAADPLAVGDKAGAFARLDDLVRAEVNRPYRDTVISNQRRDPAAVGWRRITSPGACGFCRMLADRGAVYRQDTARFAAHTPVDNCTAAPVFRGGEVGPEADAMQYLASRRTRSARDKAKLKAYLDFNYPE